MGEPNYRPKCARMLLYHQQLNFVSSLIALIFFNADKMALNEYVNLPENKHVVTLFASTTTS
jgi:hypothetical protein